LIQVPLGHSFHPPSPPNWILHQRHDRGRNQPSYKTCENLSRSQFLSALEHYPYDKFKTCLLSAFASVIS
jgi:hypothetical protein